MTTLCGCKAIRKWLVVMLDVEADYQRKPRDIASPEDPDNVFDDSKPGRRFTTLNRWSKRLSAKSVSESLKKQKAYLSCVSTSSYYSELKRLQKGSLKWFFRKISGIPFAFLYGFLIIWIISTTILGKPGGHFDLDSIKQKHLSKNICAAIFASLTNNTKRPNVHEKVAVSLKEQYIGGLAYSITGSALNGSQIDILHSSGNPNVAIYPSISGFDLEPAQNNKTFFSFTPTNITKAKNKSSILFENDSAELYYITGTAMGIVGITSIFSRNTRATMLLILPGLITRHSRNLIFTIVLGILTNGPLRNLRMNFNKILENAACMYKSGIVLTCIKQVEINKVLKYAENIYYELQNIKESFNRMFCPYGDVDRFGRPCAKLPTHPFPFPNNTLDMIETLTAPSTRGIKQQASIFVEKLYVIGSYVDLARRCLTVVSILMLIVDAIRYLRLYHTDSSYDNMCMDRLTRNYWKSKDYYKDPNSDAYWNIEKGLRRAEVNLGYKTLVFPKVTKRELYKAWMNSLPTIVFFFFVALVVFIDIFLAESLQYVKDSKAFSFSLEALDLNITKEVNVQMQDYNTKSCLSSPLYTSPKDYAVISALLATAAISCILQVYLSGIRSLLCKLFYPDRAEERADYLYYKIFTGRMNRKKELKLNVRRELERREKLCKFSPFQQMKEYLRSLLRIKKSSINCPGCGWVEKLSKAKNLVFDIGNKDKFIETKICRSCYLDTRENNEDLSDEGSLGDSHIFNY